MFGVIGAIIIAFLTLFIPGILFALALLKKTSLSKFEIIIMGFIFGIIATPTLTWVEGYLASYIHIFSFSLALFEANAVVLSIIGIVLCIHEGVFGGRAGRRGSVVLEEKHELSAERKSYEQELAELREQLKNVSSAQEIIRKHRSEEQALIEKQKAELSIISLNSDEKAKIEALHRQAYEDLARAHEKEERLFIQSIESERESVAAKTDNSTKQLIIKNWYWIVLLALMLITFYTRIANIGVSPTYFEFDPYFDMIDAQYVVTFGHQLLLDTSAWPVVAAGTNHRIQPLMPYLEAYWYDLANVLKFHYTTFSTSLMSYVSSIYPPITAALLVFVIFMLLYHEYDKNIALIGAALTAMMPVLITTFIAGEQLVEPWGIFSLFFFFAAYMLAVKEQSNMRYAVLAGIAFASTFLGAHYYTVDAAVFALYIFLQGIIDLIRSGAISRDFYKMNIVVLVVIIIFMAAYDPYHAVYGGGVPTIVGIPTTVAFPMLALIFVAITDLIIRKVSPALEKQEVITYILSALSVIGLIALVIAAMFGRLKKLMPQFSRYAVISIIVTVLVLAIFLTPLGKPFKGYLNLSVKFTTPSSPLFMTVQEFEPSGFMFNFGSAGFGALGYTLSFSNKLTGVTTNIPIVVWLVAAISILFLIISIFYRKSKTGIFYLAIAVPLMFAGFSEVKYLPHFGVVEIMLFGIILGELMLLAQSNYRLKDEAGKAESVLESTYKEHKTMFHFVLILGLFFIFGRAIVLLLLIYFIVYLYIYKKERGRYINYMLGITVLLALISLMSSQFALGESAPLLQVFTASYNYAVHGASACTSIANHGNSVGYDMFCNQVPGYWLTAAAWMRSNVGPHAPRILSWWDYGDWINWFGNSNAVLRGDNAVYTEDYATAANLVLGPAYNYTPQVLANFMNTNQTKYLLTDQGLIEKWQALDFLACIHINATSEAYAKAQGALQTPPVPYVLGTSQCEISHDPEFALVPLATLVPTNTSQSINYYCSMSNATATFAKAYMVIGNSLANQTVCVNVKPNNQGVLSVYNSNGTKMNAVIQSSYYEGIINIQGTPFVEYLLIYLPGANGTVANPPSLFYTSNYYNAFVLGKLPGFTQVYPANATGINFVNGTYPIRIFALDNFTGTLPAVPQKPSWVHNNYTMP